MKTRTINICRYIEYLVHVVHKIGYVPVCVSWRARAHREWELCEKSTYLSLCLAKGAVGV
jgi:hypothetical protein